jgi:hypothetical protein
MLLPRTEDAVVVEGHAADDAPEAGLLGGGALCTRATGGLRLRCRE